jgi:hypothetical protein
MKIPVTLLLVIGVSLFPFPSRADQVSGSLADVVKIMGPVSLSKVRDQATKDAKRTPKYRSTGIETKTFVGEYTTESDSVLLGLHCDDGSKVTIWRIGDDGEPVNPPLLEEDRYGRPQHMPDLNRSFHVLRIILQPHTRYKIQIKYSNVRYVKTVFLLLPFLTLRRDIDGCTLFTFVWKPNLMVDANRDGKVDIRDEAGKDNWIKDLGAIFSVNCDRDGDNRDAAGNPLPDAIFFDDDGNPHEVLNAPGPAGRAEIENAEDAKDIASLKIPRLGFLPPTVRVFLRVDELEDIQSIHVYRRIAAGETAVWGGLGSRVAGNPPQPLELDITPWVSETDDVVFGIEGLFFRNTGAINPFNGEIDITMEFREAGVVIASDRVRMKVAPWMMISHKSPSTELWAMSDTGGDNAAFIQGLNQTGQLQPVPGPGGEAGSRWFQDHIEIGYSQRPGAPETHVVFRLPYYHDSFPFPSPPQPGWPVTRLLQRNVGIFQLGLYIGDDATTPGWQAGSYGGNLEILPPTSTHKLGKIVVGNTRSDALWDFLTSQEVQSPFWVPTDWLEVGHVDEVFAFVGIQPKVVIADTTDAFALLDGIPPADRGRAVFFATGKMPESGVATADATAPNRIETGINHTGQTWRYIRIYSGAGAGQIARIPVGGLRNGFIEVDLVWDTGTTVTPDTIIGAPIPPTPAWTRPPRQNDRYVLMEGTLAWSNGNPAAITAQEVRDDTGLRAVNNLAQTQINTIRGTLDAEAGAGGLTFVKVPVIYVGEPVGFATGRSAIAFTPGLANMQQAAGKLIFPKQYGPRDFNGDDIFEKATKTRLQLVAPWLFIDDWSYYHCRGGEVHCGTATKRQFPSLKWWQNQP